MKNKKLHIYHGNGVERARARAKICERSFHRPCSNNYIRSIQIFFDAIFFDAIKNDYQLNWY